MRVRDEQKEKVIRQQAMEMIVRDGFEGLSMQKLAKAANVSPATIYIYFKDREDLIYQVAISEVSEMIGSTFENFNPQMNFAQGLQIQWENRMRYWISHPLHAQFMEQVRHSPMGAEVFLKVKAEFSSIMGEFVHRAIENKELMKLPLEIYWSIAFSPLYQLIKFHNDGCGMKNQPFALDKKILKQTLQLVVKALTP